MIATEPSILAPIATATAILIAGAVDDLRSRKVHNWLFLACAAVALVVVAVFGGVGAVPMALLGFVAGIGVLLPLVLLKVIGAGDMKLLAAFGIAAGAQAVITVALYSLVWGAFFGLMQVVINGQIKQVISNMFSIVVMRERQGLTLHKIPFTIALFFGWLSHLVLSGVL